MTDLDPAVRSSIEGKRLIFTVTTGRSGTNFLANFLKNVDGVTARHEPNSRFSNVMRLVQNDPDLAARFWREVKLPEIAKTPHSTYIETSHLFCKGFFEPLLELGFVPDLIVLTRDIRQVAKSIFLLGDIPGDSKWYLSPDDPGVLPLPDWRDLNDYQLCYWYCLEIERRAGEYSAKVHDLGARVVRIDLSELVTKTGKDRLLDELSLPRIPALQRLKMALRRQIVNRKRRAKRNGQRFDQLDRLDLDALEEEVDRICRAAGSDGSDVKAAALRSSTGP